MFSSSSQQRQKETSPEWASIMKASGVTSFATQPVCVEWTINNIEPNLLKWVQDHLKVRQANKVPARQVSSVKRLEETVQGSPRSVS